jgi:hypothetical protein
MNKVKLILTALRLVALSLACASFADAQSHRTFVSSDGKDSNLCISPDKPCRNIASAITKTQAGGEVLIIDSGNFEPFTVTTALTVAVAPGAKPSISVTSGAGVAVSVGMSDVVVIRGLTITSQGGARGIDFQAGVLHVENCVISGFTPLPTDCCTDAILLNGLGKLFVKDTTARGNFNGIRITPKPSPVLAVIERSRLENNTNGLYAEDNALVTLRDSLVSGGGVGITATINTGDGRAEINVENCLVSANLLGISSNGNVGGFPHQSIVRVSNTTITNNGQGLAFGPFGNPALLSRGNNTVEGNGVDGAFNGAVTAK